MNRRQVLIGLGATPAVSGFTSAAIAQVCSPSGGAYFGERNFRWIGDGRLMSLLSEFGYRDGCGESWPVPVGAVVDGASIPRSLWSIIGSPFVGLYRDASVVHDFYCDVRSRPWRRVHRVFYEAMLTSGVSRVQARVMYAAVRWFGPRWRRVMRSVSGEATMVPMHSTDATDAITSSNGASSELADFRTGLAEEVIMRALAGEMQAIGATLTSDYMSALGASLPMEADAASDGEARSLRSAGSASNARGIISATVLGSTADRSGVAIEIFEEATPDVAQFELFKNRIETEDLDVDQIDAVIDET